ncbi:hypothetical protein G7Y89_g237 [Cudoniella acicularis]|uniref:GED domain-containing protein n=1 Tax=Cudoniella acicularis TaxID=354080 RepID=A0A8H4RXI3_9HELO|nr:hypothetical protein G7Y89_g237 [Cudoniella acicularis]
MLSFQTTSRRGRVPTVDSDPESPVIETSRRKVEAEPVEEAQSEEEDYESSPEETEESSPNKSTNTILSEDPFSNESSRILFDSIDQLRRCGAGQDLDLPQLVIVGKQSAGKSSLLQSLTDIPFPVGSRLCTQFAMRIISRRTRPGTTDMVQATIEQGDVNPFSNREDDARTKDFRKNMTSMTAEAFEDLINEAKEAMGIHSPHASEDRNYSSKVLKIELSGPKRSHFGILDLPGVFSAPVRRVSRREMDGVTKMVTSYMKKPENIIICVADASGDISNEQILPLASNVDSSRLVGVFTKCDRSDNPADIVKHVNDRDGIADKTVRWFVVQNRGPKASATFNREEEEESTFNKDPWTEIPSQQRGTVMLKKHLANLLCKRIRDAFPSMLNTVTRLLETEKVHRRSFGEPRTSHSQKLSYLMEIVGRFQTLALQTLRSPSELPSDSMKLRGLAVQATEQFSTEIISCGFRHKFLEIGDDVEIPVDEEDSDSEPDDNRVVVEQNLNTPDLRASRPTRHNRNQGHGYMSGLLTPSASPARKSIHRSPNSQSHSQPKTKLHPLYAEIRRELLTNRGEELPGMLNPSVLRPLWRTQTTKWHSIAEIHIQRVVDLTTSVALDVFHLACKNVGATDRVRTGLEAYLLKFAEQSRQDVLQKLDELCDRNQNMALQTCNPQFKAYVREAQMKRFENAVARYRAKVPSLGFIMGLLGDQDAPRLAVGPEAYRDWAVVDQAHLGMLFEECHSLSVRNVEDEVHDLLRAYYEVRPPIPIPSSSPFLPISTTPPSPTHHKLTPPPQVSIQNFIHNLTHNILEPFLFSPSGPLLGLNQDFLLGLSEQEIEELAGEDENIVEQRKESEERIERLGRGWKLY